MPVVARRLHQLPGTTYAPDDKVVALTFDDAPGPNTDAVLDALKASGIPGTFFVIGENVEQDPDALVRIVRAGHAIGNHSWSHVALGQIDDDALTEEYARTHESVIRHTGHLMHHARPPYTMQHAARLATCLDPEPYSAVVGWSIDPRDWSGADAMTITEHVVEHLHPGAIVLLHAGHGEQRSTAQAVPHIVRALRVLGYRFVKL